MRPVRVGKPLGRSVFEAILARRSVRSFTEEIPPREVINTLLEAAVRAPTGLREEPWAFVIVQNRGLLDSISEQTKTMFVEDGWQRDFQPPACFFERRANADFDVFHGANTLVVICARPEQTYAVADCWLAAENLMLAASELGLGSCVVGASLAALNAVDLKHRIGIPAEYSAIAPIIIGIPEGHTEAVGRKSPLVLAWQR